MQRREVRPAWRKTAIAQGGDGGGGGRGPRGGKSWRDNCLGRGAGDAAASNSEEDKPPQAIWRRIREEPAGGQEDARSAAPRELGDRRTRGERGQPAERCRKGREGSQKRWRGKGWGRRQEGVGGARTNLESLRRRAWRKAR